MLNYVLVKSLTNNDDLESPDSLTRDLGYTVYNSYSQLFEAISEELIVIYDKINNSEIKDLVLIETIFNLLIFMVYVFWYQFEFQVLAIHDEFTNATLRFINLNGHNFLYKYSWVY